MAFYLRAPGSRQDRTYRGGGRSDNDTPDSRTLTHRDGGSVKCLVCRGAVVGSGVKVDRVDDLFSGSPMEGDQMGPGFEESLRPLGSQDRQTDRTDNESKGDRQRTEFRVHA